MGPMRNPDEVFDSWAAEFRGIYRYGRCFNLTMHPQYIGPARTPADARTPHRVHQILPNVKFMRAIDAAEMWEKH